MGKICIETYINNPWGKFDCTGISLPYQFIKIISMILKKINFDANDSSSCQIVEYVNFIMKNCSGFKYNKIYHMKLIY